MPTATDPDSWRIVPNGVLDAEQQQDAAQAWGDAQRAKIAAEWGDQQRLAAPPDTPPARDDWATSTPSAAAPSNYTVQPDDTLSGVSQRFYGDPNAYGPLAAANGISDPNQVQAGQQLRIPPAPRDAGGNSYVVQPGDNLSTIAQQTLGDGNRWRDVWAANRDQVVNPDLIQPGQRLTIPGGGQTSTPTPAPMSSQPASSQSYTGGGLPPTTAELSGGGRFSGISDTERALLTDAGDMARQAGYGQEGAHALQAVLATEGGLSGAVGDHGQSFGPLQFYTGGQLANFARQNNMTLQLAGDYVRQNPRAAIQWAIGTPDQHANELHG